jgi:CrcB protein
VNLPESSAQPVDPDIDLHERGQRRELAKRPVAVLLAIAAGGAVGAVVRYGAGTVLLAGVGEWPWSTWIVNVSGCLLIGVLMALITEVWTTQQLLRPFLGVGVLGGYTTFSTAMVEVQQLVHAGEPGLGLLYLGGTVLAALVAVTAGWSGTNALLQGFGRKGRRS